MAKITGDLSLVSLKEVVSGAEALAKTGTLRLSQDGIEKSFYFRNGKIIFVTSTQPGERFGEFLTDIGCLDLKRMQSLLVESRGRGGRFTGDLIEAGVFDKQSLETALSQLVIIALADALSWERGTLEFDTCLPEGILKGPVHLEVEGALEQACRINPVDTSRLV